MKRYEKRVRGFFWGTILILTGIIWLLKNFYLIPSNIADMILSWQMFLIVWGSLGIIRGHWFGGIVLVGIGAYFILPLIPTFPFWIHQLYWPVILILLGIILLVHRHRRYCVCRREKVKFIS